MFAVGDDCVWSAWSACSGSCGVGMRKRIVLTPKQGNGMDCTGPAQQDCDTNQPPCKTVISWLVFTFGGYQLCIVYVRHAIFG